MSIPMGMSWVGALPPGVKMFLCTGRTRIKNSTAKLATKFIAWNAELNITKVNHVRNIEWIVNGMKMMNNPWNLWRAKNSNNVLDASFGSKKMMAATIWLVDVVMNLITLKNNIIPNRESRVNSKKKLPNNYRMWRLEWNKKWSRCSQKKNDENCNLNII